MYIAKADALRWFEFFAALPEDEALLTRQQEIAYAVFPAFIPWKAAPALWATLPVSRRAVAPA